jgi:DNA modification methylase
VLKTLESESVHCCVTSPPYWGLRDYGTATWEGGEEGCDHQGSLGDGGAAAVDERTAFRTGKQYTHQQIAGPVCGKCGARRIDNQIGLEPTPELHIEALLEVFREVWRVLRKDGTLWLNYGDCYTSGDRNGHGTRQGRKQGTNRASANGHDNVRPSQPADLKPKDLVGMPWRLAFALQAEGWYLRSDIIWSKPNPMPESVTDRPTRSHEYLFLLAKSATYFYDADAIREPVSSESLARNGRHGSIGGNPHRDDSGNFCGTDPAGRNRRTVWEIATQPTPEAHFATFPEALVEPCILAGTSECGCCPDCGAPWQRVSTTTYENPGNRTTNGSRSLENRQQTAGFAVRLEKRVETTGWAPTCAHPHSEKELQPALVLDPFAGSGTVSRVASRLGRRSIGIELSAEYVETIARKRTAQGSLGL